MEPSSHLENGNRLMLSSESPLVTLQKLSNSFLISLFFHLQLFCSFCATFSLNFFMSISRGSRIGHIQLGSPGLVNFGTFGSVSFP